MANKIPRVPVREQDPQIRATNFEEVCYGYDLDEARLEASRCLHCRNPRCVAACPVSIRIPDFIGALHTGELQQAADIIAGDSSLPSICGRVCPQESQCEGSCILGIKGEPVAIGKLERFIGDWKLEHGAAAAQTAPRNGYKVAVIGKPNVGKSSLVNRVSGENRCIVSNIAGTTRDAVDTTIENKYGVFTFIDTAGLRRKSKVEDSIEHYSNLRAEMAVDRADVCVILIDATVGFTEQDSKVAGIAHEAGKGCIIAVNKWDAVEKDDKTMQEYKTKLEKDFSFMSYAPIIFISAQAGQRLDRLFELIHKVASSNAMRITTGTLNDILAQATARVQPPTDKGKRLKIYYMTQASTRPPTFICFVNSKELFHFSYQRYLENRIREIFSLEGTPVRMIVRERGDKAD